LGNRPEILIFPMMVGLTMLEMNAESDFHEAMIEIRLN